MSLCALLIEEGQATPPPAYPPYITISSPTSFTLTLNKGKVWDGVIEYSTDTTTWTTWNGEELSGTELYLRGTGNSRITYNGTTYSKWLVVGSDISISGNLEYLLDYQVTQAGGHPVPGVGAFSSMLNGQSGVIKVPDFLGPTVTEKFMYYAYSYTSVATPPILAATQLDRACYSGLFSSCKKLTTPPELPATTMARECYSGMFSESGITQAPVLHGDTLAQGCYNTMFGRCESLTVPPDLNASHIASGSYMSMFFSSGIEVAPKIAATSAESSAMQNMFYECTKLKQMPALKMSSFPFQACYSMFYGCSSLKIATSYSSAYPNAYRIPVTGTGSIVSGALSDMFKGTGGSFAGTPSINTTYYTNATIVS